MKIQLDFRFVELGYELWGLEHYREVLEEQVKFLRAQKEVQAKARLKQEGFRPEDADYQIAMQEVTVILKNTSNVKMYSREAGWNEWEDVIGAPLDIGELEYIEETQDPENFESSLNRIAIRFVNSFGLDSDALFDANGELIRPGKWC